MSTLRTVASADNLATRLRDARRARRAHHGRTERGPRELILIAFAVPVVSVLVALVIMLAVLMMAGSGLSGIGTAVATCWLAVNQVPVSIAGVSIGILPMLPTLLVAGGTAAVVASSCRSRHTLSEYVAVGASAIAGALLMTAIALAVVMDGSSVLPIQSPNALEAFGLTLVVQGLAATAGVVLGRSELVTSRLSTADRRGIRYGFAAVLALFAAGGLLILLRLILKFDALRDLVSGGYDFDGYLGLTLLSVLYLPNLIIGAAAVLVGSEAHVGAASVDLFAARGGSVPALPALAVLPEHTAWWAASGLLVPLVIGGVVAWRCRTADPLRYARSIGMAAAVAATTMVVLGWLAGGALGEIGAAGITLVTAGVYTLGWIGLSGLVIGLVLNFRPALRSRTSAVAGPDPDTDDGDWLDIVGADDDATDEYTDDYLADGEIDDGYVEDPLVDGDLHGGDAEYDGEDTTDADGAAGTDPAGSDIDATPTARPHQTRAARIDPDDLDDPDEAWTFDDADAVTRTKR
ncbi:hypothetical protein EF294_02805 [Gordonia oryzae]|uniref:Uncharacterized protein n=1 Tax=Gordonia oryzae TaxID=2487349 RepID=A0A3N4GRV9_9ACTN|nr:DUF6350 family protein [Gordonia oryzae]RPA65693.1 hypothetical protein EF294_02805 [Gordonia oryzae]